MARAQDERKRMMQMCILRFTTVFTTVLTTLTQRQMMQMCILRRIMQICKEGLYYRLYYCPYYH